MGMKVREQPVFAMAQPLKRSGFPWKEQFCSKRRERAFDVSHLSWL